jgi:hypothetical protein
MSSRLSTANTAATSAAHVPYALFADFNFVSGHVRLSSYDQAYTFGGNTYQALGKFCNFGDYPETADLTASALTFTLSGVDSSLMSTVLTEKYHNRDCTLYVGWLDANNALVDTPYLLWEGLMDSMQLHSDEQQSSITLTCETRLLLMGKTSGWMYADVHQKQFKTGDNFFNLVASLANKIVNWGSAAPASAAAGS